MTSNDNKAQLLLFPNKEAGTRTFHETSFVISHEHVVQALDFYLRAHNLWPYPGFILVDADLGIELNEEGFVEVDVVLEDEDM